MFRPLMQPSSGQLKNRISTLVCAQYGIPYVYMCLYMQGRRTSAKIFYVMVKQSYANRLSWATRKLLRVKQMYNHMNNVRIKQG
jgi:hypothetical protein